MTPANIRELLTLRNWSVTDLAEALGASSNCVYRWLAGNRNPKGAAVILMRGWLDEAKKRKKR